MSFYIKRGDKVSSGNSHEQIQLLLKKGNLHKDDLISKKQTGPWHRIDVFVSNTKKQANPQPRRTNIPYEISTQFLSKQQRVKYKCPKCAVSLKNRLSEAGNSDQCPDCGTKFTVPGIAEKEQHEDEHQPRLDEIKNRRRKSFDGFAKRIIAPFGAIGFFGWSNIAFFLLIPSITILVALITGIDEESALWYGYQGMRVGAIGCIWWPAFLLTPFVGWLVLATLFVAAEIFVLLSIPYIVTLALGLPLLSASISLLVYAYVNFGVNYFDTDYNIFF